MRSMTVFGQAQPFKKRLQLKPKGLSAQQNQDFVCEQNFDATFLKSCFGKRLFK